MPGPSSESPDPNNKENYCASNSKQVKVSKGTKPGNVSIVAKKDRKSCGVTKSPLLAGVSGSLLKKLKIGKEVNTSEYVVFDSWARPYRVELDGGGLDDKPSCGWTKCMPGPLRLYCNKNGGTRLVHRNPVTGVVKLNLAIRGNVVCLEQVTRTTKKKGRKPKSLAYVRFFAKADEERGLECFLIKVKPEKRDVLYDTLEELGAKVKEEY